MSLLMHISIEEPLFESTLVCEDSNDVDKVGISCPRRDSRQQKILAALKFEREKEARVEEVIFTYLDVHRLWIKNELQIIFRSLLFRGSKVLLK